MERYFNRNFMHTKLYLIVFELLICSISMSGQVYESIEQEAANVLLSTNNPEEAINLEKLKNILFSDIDNTLLEKTYNVKTKDLDSLKNHFNEFESELKNISKDSAFVLFNDWYLHFQNIFYEYSKEKFFSSPKTKILLFSTSMSCYCTLKMSQNQIVELLKFISENGNHYNYWIIDSFWHNELQIEYETLFAPSVVVFDGSNKVLYKIEYDEKMLSLLNDYLISIKN